MATGPPTAHQCCMFLPFKYWTHTPLSCTSEETGCVTLVLKKRKKKAQRRCGKKKKKKHASLFRADKTSVFTFCVTWLDFQSWYAPSHSMSLYVCFLIMGLTCEPASQTTVRYILFVCLHACAKAEGSRQIRSQAETFASAEAAWRENWPEGGGEGIERNTQQKKNGESAQLKCGKTVSAYSFSSLHLFEPCCHFVLLWRDE